MNLLLCLLQLLFNPNLHPISFLVISSPFFLFCFNPPLAFCLRIIATSCPRAHLPTNHYLFSPAKCWAARVQEVILNLIPAAAASSTVYLMSTLISCSDPFINILRGWDFNFHFKVFQVFGNKPTEHGCNVGVSLHVSHLCWLFRLWSCHKMT